MAYAIWEETLPFNPYPGLSRLKDGRRKQRFSSGSRSRSDELENPLFFNGHDREMQRQRDSQGQG